MTFPLACDCEALICDMQHEGLRDPAMAATYECSDCLRDQQAMLAWPVELIDLVEDMAAPE